MTAFNTFTYNITFYSVFRIIYSFFSVLLDQILDINNFSFLSYDFEIKYDPDVFLTDFLIFTFSTFGEKILVKAASE